MSISQYSSIAVLDQELPARAYLAQLLGALTEVGKRQSREMMAIGRAFCIARSKCEAEGIPFGPEVVADTGYSYVSIWRMMNLHERLGDKPELVERVPVSTLYEWVSPSTSDDQLNTALSRLAAGDAPKQITADLKAARPAAPRSKPKPAPVDVAPPAPEPIEAEYRPVATATATQPPIAFNQATASMTDYPQSMPVQMTPPVGSREHRIANEIRLAIADTKGFSFATVMDELRTMAGPTAAQRIASSFIDKLAKVAN